MTASLVLCLSVSPLFAQDEQKRLANSASALQEILSEDNGLPKAILDKGFCVIIFPGVKKVATQAHDSSYGSGGLVCRKGTEMDGSWGAPAMYALDMASLDLQVGLTETDFVLVIASQKGVDRVLNGKIKLGSNVVATKGPVGAHAASYNIERNTDLLIYARFEGPFGGVSLARASMNSDERANKAIYGKDESAKDIVHGNQAVIPAAKPLVDLLDSSSPRRK